jgi:hypothetical protein
MGLKATPMRLWNRIYGDFLAPGRLGQYRLMLEAFLDAGYRAESIQGFWGLLNRGEVPAHQKYLILRHDVDSNPRAARAIWSIEQTLSITSSYYFRLSTIDIQLMNWIVEHGGEASYHYEELSTLARQRHLTHHREGVGLIPDSQTLFLRNLEMLRRATGLPMPVVAAHGDFANRKLGIPNFAPLADSHFRHVAGIELEAYDEALMDHVTSRHSDAPYPVFWKPVAPLEAIEARSLIVYLLVHPGYWQPDRILTAREDVGRLIEGAKFALPALRNGEPRG